MTRHSLWDSQKADAVEQGKTRNMMNT